MGDAMLPPGNRVYWKSAVLNDLDEALLETVIEHTEHIPSPLSAVVIEFYGGAASRVGVGDTAYPHRDSLHSINPLAIWTDPSHDEPNIEWARGVFEASRRFSAGGVYANFLGVGDAGDDRVRAAYGPNYDRLARIKTKYDPTNVFHHNVNVKPIELPE
jgi:FAD/FMN-containing dehydrogenase